MSNSLVNTKSIPNHDAWTGPKGLRNKLTGLPNICIDGIDKPQIENVSKEGDEMLLVASSCSGSHAIIRLYHQGLLTVDIQHYVTKSENDETYDYQYIKLLEKKIKSYLGEGCSFSRRFVIFSNNDYNVPGPIRRGVVCPFFASGDGFIYEYGKLELILEKDSQWQNIKIYKTERFGNMLCLDDDIMIADSDTIYTDTLLGTSRNDFSGKRVLILGGGDGGILHGLLKEKPKHIQIEDCMDLLHQLASEGQRFDYVVNDLTEYVVGAEKSFEYDFDTASVILEMSTKVLEESGKYLSRGNMLSAATFLARYEKDLQILDLEYKRYDIDVPSYREPYPCFLNNALGNALDVGLLKEDFSSDFIAFGAKFGPNLIPMCYC
ncbi:hypothetical protein ScPMuIL_002587 [Solemya velum]